MSEACSVHITYGAGEARVHTPVWMLLALFSFGRTALLLGGSRAAYVAALLALPAHGTFLGTLAMDRRPGRHRSCGIIVMLERLRRNWPVLVHHDSSNSMHTAGEGADAR
jgi:hypothetical protein